MKKVKLKLIGAIALLGLSVAAISPTFAADLIIDAQNNVSRVNLEGAEPSDFLSFSIETGDSSSSSWVGFDSKPMMDFDDASKVLNSNELRIKYIHNGAKTKPLPVNDNGTCFQALLIAAATGSSAPQKITISGNISGSVINPVGGRLDPASQITCTLG